VRALLAPYCQISNGAKQPLTIKLTAYFSALLEFSGGDTGDRHHH